jgi:hypothetical protein
MFGFSKKKIVRYNSSELLKKHFTEEEIEKIKSTPKLYEGINESINTGIENTRNFIRSVAQTCPNLDCPVKNILCEECEEKPCKVEEK